MTEQVNFEQWVVRHQGAVCAVAFAVLRDRARSEEVAQEAFLIAWQKLPALPAPPALPGWLCGIARNLALNAARRKRETAMSAEPASPLDDPRAALLDREAADLASRALASLSDADREVVVLYYRGDETLAEVGAALGLAPAAVRKRLERARTRLRSAFTSVESLLRSTRPGPAFTAGCVAALALGASVSLARADIASRSIRWSRLGASAGGAVGAAVLLASVSAPISASPSRASSSVAASPTAVERSPAPRLDAPARADRLARITAARSARASAPAPVHASPAAPTSTDPDLQPIMPPVAAPLKTFDFSGGALDGPLAPPPDPATLTIVSKSTLRYAIQSVQPLLLECYRASGVTATGVINLKIRLVTDPDVGTAVESASVASTDFTPPPALVECMTETLLSISLPTLSDPAVLLIHYPFTLPGTPRSAPR